MKNYMIELFIVFALIFCIYAFVKMSHVELYNKAGYIIPKEEQVSKICYNGFVFVNINISSKIKGLVYDRDNEGRLIHCSNAILVEE